MQRKDKETNWTFGFKILKTVIRITFSEFLEVILRQKLYQYLYVILQFDNYAIDISLRCSLLFLVGKR